MYYRYFLKLAYNGTHFSGWQWQPRVPTVQEAMETVLSAMLHEKITCMGCGRTDAGVHASMYYAHIDAQRDDLHTDEVFLFRLNKSLPDGIAVDAIYRMEDNAHARFSARSRSYEYHITRKKNALSPDLAWYFHEPLNVPAMNEAASLLVRNADFVAFSKTGNTTSTSLCDVRQAKWVAYDDHLVFHITSNRFLRNMVRAVVGTLVEVGRGNIPVRRTEEILLSRQAPVSGFTVPARGLFLSDIRYPAEFGLQC